MTRTAIVVSRLAALAVLCLCSAVLAQDAPRPRAPLVPCTAVETGPCALVATSVADTVAPYGTYPRGSISFDGDIATILVDGDAVPPECRTARFQIHVLRFGTAQVALAYLPIEDECPGRRADMALPLLNVGD